ncbi:hypothetical protein GOP47_0008030 [Adiantum capillus-veneris]|uniref:Uncharacterized protein n=1 Tax=Adiantum capillus-veneris TaxID=13818 RepID=A0A9D4UY58_ADICA|nr:hypothetical protein GOP47_0008030 [Adiantum capillus-veneris]
MLTGCPKGKQCGDTSSLSRLWSKHVYEQSSLAWKATHSDNLDKDINAIFLRHTGFYYIQVQSYLDEVHKTVVAVVNKIDEETKMVISIVDLIHEEDQKMIPIVDTV